ncbi:MAG: AmmeMemoRadiSam system protein A [Bacteroidota bacterium]
MILTEEEKRDLIQIARDAILGNLNKAMAKKLAQNLSANLQICCGAFVSIYLNGKLRGCIGTFSEETPLFENVRNMAVSAATSDTRFDPIDPSELDRVRIEISVLTPRVRVYDISEIVPGTHGIFMKKGINRGTFLPQVALSQNWTREELLGNCAKNKAGIGWEGWKTADLFTYEALVFSSEER